MEWREWSGSGGCKLKNEIRREEEEQQTGEGEKRVTKPRVRGC